MTEQGSNPQGSSGEVGAGRQTGPTAPAGDQQSSASRAADVELEAEQEAVANQAPADGDDSPGLGEGAHPDTALAAERLVDLQRLQAEYVNYKRRVDRDRAVVQERAARSVVEALLPVLDDIHAAREHGDLEGGPFASIADKLESTLGKFGLERYGAVGEEFDPALHEALMHTAWPQDGSVTATGSTTVVQVLQPGYRAGEQVLRAARVAVADPE
ncbi:MAG: nucleotide exchange factor GrpE [Pedococcus sp.]